MQDFTTTWDMSTTTWLGGSTQYCNREELAAAIENDPHFKRLLDRTPTAHIHLKWDHIKNSPDEFLDWKERVQAMHVITATAAATQVDAALHVIHHS